MNQREIDLAELMAAEDAAKQEWEQAVQSVKAANDKVGRAHTKWLGTQRAIEAAKNRREKLKERAASADS